MPFLNKLLLTFNQEFLPSKSHDRCLFYDAGAEGSQKSV